MSYTAHQDDYVLQFFGCRRDGFLIEVGANDPVVGSLTLRKLRHWRHGASAARPCVRLTVRCFYEGLGEPAIRGKPI